MIFPRKAKGDAPSLFLALGLVAVALTFATVWYLLQPPKPGKPWNVLVLSFCSLRVQDLAAYGAKDSVTPALDAFSRSGLVFENAFNGIPWIGLFAWLRTSIPEREFERLNYERLGTVQRDHLLRIPQRHDRQTEKKGENRNSRDDAAQNLLEKKHGADLAELKARVTAARHKPFYLVAHFKYLHYPMIDRHNPDSAWDRFLTEDEKARVQEYVQNPNAYPDQLPFRILLSADHNLGEQLGFVSNPEALKRWSAHPNYAGDLTILRKIYRANLAYLDSVIAEVLNLYGDRELQRNTMVIVVGDHGEMHMERGLLTHGMSLFDEGLKVPLFMRLPGGEGGGQRVSGQIDFSRLSTAIHLAMQGRLNEVRVREMAVESSHFLIRDCADTQRGVREANTYKYIFDVSTGTAQLYDLRADPGETRNVADAQPEVVTRLEGLYWAGYEKFKEQLTYRCRPWADL